MHSGAQSRRWRGATCGLPVVGHRGGQLDDRVAIAAASGPEEEAPDGTRAKPGEPGDVAHVGRRASKAWACSRVLTTSSGLTTTALTHAAMPAAPARRRRGTSPSSISRDAARRPRCAASPRRDTKREIFITNEEGGKRVSALLFFNQRKPLLLRVRVRSVASPAPGSRLLVVYEKVLYK